MPYPPLCLLLNEGEYRMRYEAIYCRSPLTTFDRIQVRFRKSCFDHCFYESSQRDSRKDLFSPPRAQRIDWIKAALEDAQSELYVGWDKYRRRYDESRRVSIVCESYVVVIRLTGPLSADFVTAYLADSSRTLEQIRKSPRWSRHPKK